jgi:hypothetical protein
MLFPATIGLPSYIVRESDGAFIPVDPGNADYQAYLIWLGAPNTPDAPPAPAAVVPASVTRWQAMQQMLATPSLVHAAPATVFSDVQAAVTATGGSVLLAWQNQAYVYRNGPFVAGIATPLGLTPAILDSLFIAAAQLPP